MTSEELAREVMKLATRAAVRVQGTGTDQYLREDGTQEFEHMTPERLLEETLDEAADLISYATMTALAVQRLITLVERARGIGGLPIDAYVDKPVPNEELYPPHYTVRKDVWNLSSK